MNKQVILILFALVAACVVAFIPETQATAQDSPILPEGMENCPQECIVICEQGVPSCSPWCVQTMDLDVPCKNVGWCFAGGVTEEEIGCIQSIRWHDTGELWMGKYPLYVDDAGNYCVSGYEGRTCE